VTHNVSAQAISLPDTIPEVLRGWVEQIKKTQRPLSGAENLLEILERKVYDRESGELLEQQFMMIAEKSRLALNLANNTLLLGETSRVGGTLIGIYDQIQLMRQSRNQNRR